MGIACSSFRVASHNRDAPPCRCGHHYLPIQQGDDITGLPGDGVWSHLHHNVPSLFLHLLEAVQECALFLQDDV